MDNSKKTEVRNFLKELKEIITSSKGIYFVSRKERYKNLAELGFTKKNAEDEILSLSVLDFCSKEEDKDRQGHVWIFGKEIGNKGIYIKLKIDQAGNEKKAKCISFHPAQHTLNYEFK